MCERIASAGHRNRKSSSRILQISAAIAESLRCLSLAVLMLQLETGHLRCAYGSSHSGPSIRILLFHHRMSCKYDNIDNAVIRMLRHIISFSYTEFPNETNVMANVNSAAHFCGEINFTRNPN